MVIHAVSYPMGADSSRINGDEDDAGHFGFPTVMVGLASLRCQRSFSAGMHNGMVAKTEISASYRHVSTKILTELRLCSRKGVMVWADRKDRLKLSWKVLFRSPCHHRALQQEFALGEREKDAVAWACLIEARRSCQCGQRVIQGGRMEEPGGEQLSGAAVRGGMGVRLRGHING